MGDFYIKGKQVSGSTNNASAITCTDKDGAQSTVQTELDKQNKKTILNFLNKSYETSSTGRESKLFKIHGSGYIFISASIESDSTNDTGTTEMRLSKNDICIAFSGNRLATAAANAIGCNTCIFIDVTDGDTITATSLSTKNGNKTLYFNIMCIGECSIEEV